MRPIDVRRRVLRQEIAVTRGGLAQEASRLRDGFAKAMLVATLARFLAGWLKRH